MEHAFMEANRIYLRAIEKKDLGSSFFDWSNDKEVTHFLFMGVFPNMMENLEAWYEDLRKSDKDVVFMIVDKDKNKEIGFCGFHQIRWLHRNAEYRIFIGDKAYWGKGYGQEVNKLMLRYGFELLNFNRIWLGVNASHLRAIGSYEKSGFVKEGLLSQEIYRNSRYYDVVRMAVLRDDYYAQYKKTWDKEIPNVFDKEI